MLNDASAPAEQRSCQVKAERAAAVTVVSGVCGAPAEQRSCWTARAADQRRREQLLRGAVRAEKLLDCLVTGVVPVYWGCRRLADVFDPGIADPSK